MSVEWFLKLKEIDSLNKMRINHLKDISEQEDRLSSLNKRRDEGISQTVKLKQDHSSLHQNLLETESRLKIADEQRQRLVDTGGEESKIKTYQQQVDNFEEEGLKLLEQIENCNTEIKEANQFLEGLDKTIAEIQDEVKQEVNQHKREIEKLDLRLELLKNELPDDFKQILQRVTAKNLAMGPFTRVEAGSCYFCRYKMSRIDESEIDMQKGLKACPQCGRIFLPYGA